jgi:glycerol-1-phosphate dehydrogenase [NAD(P)+]
MDGYASSGASVIRDGYKQTLPCPAPWVVVADLDVLAAAPSRLNAAGYADLLAKVPAGADWLIADAVGEEPIDAHAWTLVQSNLHERLENPSAIRRGDRAALALLIEGLLLSGLAMQATGSTRPASGAEHQFSHLWDMQRDTNCAPPMHGEQVGIGTMVAVAIYEQVLQKDPDEISLEDDQTAAHWPTWDKIEVATRLNFPDPVLADQIVAEQRKKYVDIAALRDRLKRLRSKWQPLQQQLRRQLMTAQHAQNLLASVGAPKHPEEIGISRSRLKVSCVLAQQIRSRYTVLDLVYQNGWWDGCVNTLFRSGGFWQ